MNFLRHNKISLFYILGVWFLLFYAKVSAAIEYTPLIDSGFLDGPKADLQTASVSYLAIVASIAGIGLIIRVLTR